jgi:general secretion pathway protein L
VRNPLAKLKILAGNKPSKAGSATGDTRDRLDLLLPVGWPESGDPVFWRWAPRGATPQSGHTADLRQLPNGALRAPTHVWTPAADTSLTQATLPTTSRRRIAQALPYALEDQLLGEPESLHFAYRTEADGRLSVAVTARERVHAWTEALTRLDIHPKSICPATLLTPWALDSWSLAFHNNQILVRTASAAGFVCPASGAAPPAMLGAAIREAMAGSLAPESLIVFQPPRDFAAERWSDLLGVPVRVEAASLWDKLAEAQAPLNLLQGEFTPGGEQTIPFRPFIPAAVMLAIWFVGNAAFDTVEWWQLNRLHQSYSSEMTTIFLKAFPETKTVLDPAGQMQRALDSLQTRQGGQGMMPLLAQVAPTLAGESGVRVRGLRYVDKSLTVELTLANAAALDPLKQKLGRNGLRIDVLGTTSRGNETDGRLRIAPAPTAATPG